jgi:hypothetical protein
MRLNIGLEHFYVSTKRENAPGADLQERGFARGVDLKGWRASLARVVVKFVIGRKSIRDCLPV